MNRKFKVRHNMLVKSDNEILVCKQGEILDISKIKDCITSHFPKYTFDSSKITCVDIARITGVTLIEDYEHLKQYTFNEAMENCKKYGLNYLGILRVRYPSTSFKRCMTNIKGSVYLSGQDNNRPMCGFSIDDKDIFWISVDEYTKGD